MNPHNVAKQLSRQYQQNVDLYIDIKGIIHFRFLWKTVDRYNRPYILIAEVSSGKTTQEAVAMFHDQMTYESL